MTENNSSLSTAGADNAAARIRAELFKMGEKEYAAFTAKLNPTVDPERIIGVRVPALRKFAAGISGTPDAAAFMAELPHKYHEENSVHAFLIERITDYNETVKAVNKFLPFVDNWATCDMMSPKSFKKHHTELSAEINRWLSSGETYTVRFAVCMLMRHFLDEDFKPEYNNAVANIISDEYYVNMARAWYFATALCKRYDATVPLFTGKKLDKFTHNKSIQKAVESFRISDETKRYLRTLKIK